MHTKFTTFPSSVQSSVHLFHSTTSKQPTSERKPEIFSRNTHTHTYKRTNEIWKIKTKTYWKRARPITELHLVLISKQIECEEVKEEVETKTTQIQTECNFYCCLIHEHIQNVRNLSQFLQFTANEVHFESLFPKNSKTTHNIHTKTKWERNYSA